MNIGSITAGMKAIDRRLDNITGDNLPLLTVYDYTMMTAEEIAEIPKHTGAIVRDLTRGGKG